MKVFFAHLVLVLLALVSVRASQPTPAPLGKRQSLDPSQFTDPAVIQSLASILGTAGIASYASLIPPEYSSLFSSELGFISSVAAGSIGTSEISAELSSLSDAIQSATASASAATSNGLSSSSTASSPESATSSTSRPATSSSATNASLRAAQVSNPAMSLAVLSVTAVIAGALLL